MYFVLSIFPMVAKTTFQPEHGRFDQRASVITDPLLSSLATVTTNAANRFVSRKTWSFAFAVLLQHHVFQQYHATLTAQLKNSVFPCEYLLYDKTVLHNHSIFHHRRLILLFLKKWTFGVRNDQSGFGNNFIYSTISISNSVKAS